MRSLDRPWYVERKFPCHGSVINSVQFNSIYFNGRLVAHAQNIVQYTIIKNS